MYQHTKSAYTCLVTIGILLFLLLSGIALFNILIDPYEIFPYRLYGTAKQKRNSIVDQSYFIKAIGITREKPENLILGTSIVDRGFSIPGSTEAAIDDHFNANMQRLETLIKHEDFYNAGVRGGGLQVIFPYLEHAYRNNQHLKRVVIGLDWSNFTEAPIKKVPQVDVLNKTSIPLNVYLQRLLSWHSTRDAYLTLRENSAHITRLSNKIGSKLALFDGCHFTIFGHSQLFCATSPDIDMLVGRDKKNIPNILDLFFSLRYGLLQQQNLELTHGALVNAEALADIKRIVTFCKTKHIQLDVYFSPQPGIFWETIKRFGLESSVDESLRQLAKITPYWDFSGKIDFNKNGEYYFPEDAIHFNAETGKIILTTILNGRPANNGIHFVTSDNVESIIRYRHDALKNWLNQHDYLKDIFLHSNLIHYMLQTKGDFLQIVPLRYNTAYKNFTIFKFMGNFMALPEKAAPYDLRLILMKKYPHMLTGVSPEDLVTQINNHPIIM